MFRVSLGSSLHLSDFSINQINLVTSLFSVTSSPILTRRVRFNCNTVSLTTVSS